MDWIVYLGYAEPVPEEAAADIAASLYREQALPGWHPGTCNFCLRLTVDAAKPGDAVNLAQLLTTSTFIKMLGRDLELLTVEVATAEADQNLSLLPVRDLVPAR